METNRKGFLPYKFHWGVKKINKDQKMLLNYHLQCNQIVRKSENIWREKELKYYCIKDQKFRGVCFYLWHENIATGCISVANSRLNKEQLYQKEQVPTGTDSSQIVQALGHQRGKTAVWHLIMQTLVFPSSRKEMQLLWFSISEIRNTIWRLVNK